jgi:NAD(P)-dependent dehydrogenase (short-subunit alcohol dehydrogenase family)
MASSDTPRVALITGASRGLGASIAHSLAAQGHKLALLGRDEAHLTKVAAETKGIAIVCDITDAAALDAAVARTESELGPVQILVQNAGIALSSPFGATSDEEWDRLFDVNVKSAFRLARALVPKMAKMGWGRLVNVASIAGVSGSAYTVGYCASKHALVGMTRAIAAEFATRGVTSNAVCPGFCDTEMTDRTIATIVQKTGRSAEEAKKTLENMSPQRRLVPPENVAHIVAMLCAEAASSVNGQAIPVDGGQVMT